MQNHRRQSEIPFTWANGATDSDTQDLSGGSFGTLIVPTGSDLIGKTLNFVAVARTDGKYADTELLAADITLAAGANPLTTDQIAAVGAVGRCKLRVDSVVDAVCQAVLLWKS